MHMEDFHYAQARRGGGAADLWCMTWGGLYRVCTVMGWDEGDLGS
jgi:hypothetical protein